MAPVAQAFWPMPWRRPGVVMCHDAPTFFRMTAVMTNFLTVARICAGRWEYLTCGTGGAFRGMVGLATCDGAGFACWLVLEELPFVSLMTSTTTPAASTAAPTARRIVERVRF